jgi:hypothetical protein
MTFDGAFGQIQAARYKLVRMAETGQGRDVLLTVSEHAEPHAATLRFCGRFQARQRCSVI